MAETTMTSGSSGRLRVVGSALVTPRMLRITARIDLPHLPIDPACPNLVLRLAPPAPAAGAGRDAAPGGQPAPPVPSSTRPPSRTYTIRRYDPRTATLDLDVVLHGDGLFVRWARAAGPGDVISFTGPRPHAVPSFDGSALVMITDETGLPALAAILEAAPAGHRVIARVEVADQHEEQPVHTAADLDLRWWHRSGASAGTTGALERAARELAWPDGRTEVWVAGETSEVRAVRRFAATERGVTREDLHAFGYWRRGRAGATS